VQPGVKGESGVKGGAGVVGQHFYASALPIEGRRSKVIPSPSASISQRFAFNWHGQSGVWRVLKVLKWILIFDKQIIKCVLQNGLKA